MRSRLLIALVGVGGCLTLTGCLGDRPSPINQAPSAAAPAQTGAYPQDGTNGRPGQRGSGPYGGAGGTAGIGTGGGRGGNGGRGGDSD
jgi:hypothetical protein